MIKRVFAAFVAKTKGWRTYALAFIFILPDLLDQLVGVEWTAIFPETVASKIGTILLIARVAFGMTIRAIAMNRPAAATEAPSEISEDESKP